MEWDAPELNVADYVLYYIDKTLKFRLLAWSRRQEDVKQLFLSHRTGKPVKTASISRWLREVLSLSGIDISTFGPHSTRGASVSEAARRGATPAKILAHGNLKSLGCYQRFYDREIHDTPVGHLILQASQCECLFCLAHSSHLPPVLPFLSFPFSFI